jgi:ankyrin repeat protein
MGNSLSQESQSVLQAAELGAAGVLKRQIAEEPRLLGSKTLVKRRGVLHLGARGGHADVVSAVLDPLLDDVRTEYQVRCLCRARPACSHRAGASVRAVAATSNGCVLKPTTHTPAACAWYALQAFQAQQRKQQEHTQLQPQPQPQAGQDAAAAADPQGSPPTQPPSPAPSPTPSSSDASSVEQQLLSFQTLRHTVNARDVFRRTPLIVAAKQGHLDCVRLLVEAAANLFAMDREGNT